ncbi:hypothetical protein VOLCADRAFT_97880 [Volvox carteri f. nagariensis]|uniref:Uncharacterized protein n=1 Tax=Volvox carteri f. nagariensis TaxID=3068 RepID=D8UDW4_VOLCA|nr:uncharacterized protein VOLCADRAFT_97880 [Volvox carteri f. nagariensis]EFJ42162.1 hypothetical protein VOLCADRAFT_97880 [Volvox carteri f. nagariensis]|eukprot:XP_002956859.1 hypothetical protein VOLCADRAFT_97880 [Volvox carteri f. nagariensis]
MSEFVLVCSHPDSMRKVCSNTLMASVVSKRCTPMLIVEVKAAVDVAKHLWQPLATAPVWVLLTDMQTWYFAKVQHAGPQPQTNEQGAAAAAAQAPTSVVLQDPAASPMWAKASLYVYSIQLYGEIHAGMQTTDNSNYYKVLQQLLQIMYPGLHLRELPTRQDAGQEVINSQTESWVKQSLVNAKEIANLAVETAKLAAAAVALMQVLLGCSIASAMHEGWLEVAAPAGTVERADSAGGVAGLANKSGNGPLQFRACCVGHKGWLLVPAPTGCIAGGDSTGLLWQQRPAAV